MVCTLAASGTCEGHGDDAVQYERNKMTTQKSFETPDQAEIERHIARAQQMRSAYLAQSAKSGWAAVRSLFTPKSWAAKSA